MALRERGNFQGMVVRALRVASRISADLRSVCADASHGANDGSRGVSQTQQEASESFGQSLVVLLGYCFVSGCHTRFTAEGVKDLVPGPCRACRRGPEASRSPRHRSAAPRRRKDKL